MPNSVPVLLYLGFEQILSKCMQSAACWKPRRWCQPDVRPAKQWCTRNRASNPVEPPILQLGIQNQVLLMTCFTYRLTMRTAGLWSRPLMKFLLHGVGWDPVSLCAQIHARYHAQQPTNYLHNAMLKCQAYCYARPVGVMSTFTWVSLSSFPVKWQQDDPMAMFPMFPIARGQLVVVSLQWRCRYLV